MNETVNNILSLPAEYFKNKTTGEIITRINDLDLLNINNVYFSCKKFRNYTNIIIHYKGKSIHQFLSSVTKILTYLVLDLYEDNILRKLISDEYFYFSTEEQKSIFNICINNLNTQDLLTRIELIENAFYEYLISHKSINLKGFIDFRLFNYAKYLDSIIDICVNKFIIDKEYLDFVNLLKTYINSCDYSISSIHLIYKNQESILLDNNKKIIPINENAFKAHFLSDISFSSNDYALNSLLTLLPKKLYIHLLDEEDEFINTLKLIFESRIKICTDCNICSLYRNTRVRDKL